MLDFTTAEQIERLEREIESIRKDMDLLECKSFHVSISEERSRLSKKKRALEKQLDAIRPYSVTPTAHGYLVAKKGMFIFDETGKNFRRFETAADAQAWIDGVAA